MINIDFYTNFEDEINIQKYNKFLEEYKEKINKIIEKALELNDINIRKVYLGIGIVSQDEIQKLNKEHREVDRATDVLSFPMFTEEEFKKLDDVYLDEEELSIGDIVLCLDIIEKQAVEYGTGFNREMLYMITHGICHLLGYDHIEESDKVKMRELEEKILAKIGEI